MINRRINIYIIVSLGLLATYPVVSYSTWVSSAELHTIIEIIAMLLALIVGSMALVRYYSAPENKYLIIGTGFLGTGFLDGYHAVVTSTYFKLYMPSDLPSLIPWSWVSSRMFLAVLLYLSWVIWKHESKKPLEERLIHPSVVYLGTGIATCLFFLFFAFVELPPAYYPDSFLHRPEELIPGLFFALALFGYLSKEEWKQSSFEHWLVLCLIVNAIGEIVIMSNSASLFDAEFDMAHYMKDISYICALIGLMISMYHSFQQLQIEILKRKSNELKLQKLSFEDELTKLPNRRYLYDRFLHASDIADRSGEKIAVMCLDLDKFKAVNDSFGHDVGDQLLKEVSQRILSCLRKVDLLSRTGGDEFVVLLETLQDQDLASHVAHRIVEEVSEPYFIENHEVHIGVSIGLSFYPDDGASFRELLKKSDRALYHSKSSRGVFTAFSE